MPIPSAEPFNRAMLESLAKELGECGTGNQIANAFRELRMVESGKTKYPTPRIAFRLFPFCTTAWIKA